MTRDFDDLVGGEGLDPGEEARLRGVHDLLLQAGPPPDLTPSLEEYGAHELPDADAELVQFPLLPRRRLAAAVVLAAALALAAFGAGYLVGHRNDPTFDARRVYTMHGSDGAIASIQAGERDDVGNWEMHFNVSGLPEQGEGGYYTLYLLKHGKPVVVCGSFRVNGKTTKLVFTVPYKARNFEGWVVTRQAPGHHEPGPVVLST
jgi:hypothetical protein